MIDIFSKKRIFVFIIPIFEKILTILETKSGFSPIIYGHSY